MCLNKFHQELCNWHNRSVKLPSLSINLSLCCAWLILTLKQLAVLMAYDRNVVKLPLNLNIYVTLHKKTRHKLQIAKCPYKDEIGVLFLAKNQINRIPQVPKFDSKFCNS